MRRTLVVGAVLLVVFSLVTIGAGDAEAARRRFAWLWDTDVVPERTTELEWWVWERAGDPRPAVYLVAAGVVGLTDTIELALPLELGLRADGPGALASYGLDLRWRLAPADPAKAGPVVPLLRVGVRRLVQSGSARFDLDAVVSFDAGDLRIVVDAGGFATTGSEQVYAAGGAGLSYGLTDELRAGVEAYGEAALVNGEGDDRWVSVGPNLAFSHGRFWVTASLPIGIGKAAPDFLPKIVWAIAF